MSLGLQEPDQRRWVGYQLGLVGLHIKGVLIGKDVGTGQHWEGPSFPKCQGPEMPKLNKI